MDSIFCVNTYQTMQMDMPASLPFSKAFDFASGAIGDRFQNPFWKAKEFVCGGPLRRAVFEVKRFGDAIVATAVEKRAHKVSAQELKAANPLRNNLIDSLLDHIEDHRVVADAAMNYLSAGIWITKNFLFYPANVDTRKRHNCSILDMDLLSSYASP